MTPALQATLAICALVLTLVQLASKLGWLAGRSGGATEMLAADVQALRTWRHKLGEDPCDALSRRVDYHVEGFERRITKLETRVFNGGIR